MKLIYSILWIMLILTCSCRKLVEVQAPITSTNSANVYQTDATAISVLTGIYTTISGLPVGATNTGGITSISAYSGLSADEFTLFSSNFSVVSQAYYKNSLTSVNPSPVDLWSNLYKIILSANEAVEGLTASSSLTPAVKQQLLGEAKFMRAFCYFYLVNLYGDVAMPLSSNYALNSQLARTPRAQVYQQIVADLTDPKAVMADAYVDGTVLTTTTERTRPNKWVAVALLARVYLYLGDFPNAYTQANSIINNSNYSLVPFSATANVFDKNSPEAIWQLQPVGFGTQNTPDALLYILPATGPSTTNYLYLSNYLLNAFETGDQRKANWTGSVTAGGTTYYYPYKYKINDPSAPIQEYEMVFRLAEQYLIRAEAEAGGAGGGASAAVADINVIRARAGLKNYAGATDKTTLTAAILHERQVELFTEWGQRWLDLKRTGTVDAVMGTGGVCAAKGGSWNTNWQLYPIPQSDIVLDNKLAQNPGY